MGLGPHEKARPTVHTTTPRGARKRENSTLAKKYTIFPIHHSYKSYTKHTLKHATGTGHSTKLNSYGVTRNPLFFHFIYKPNPVLSQSLVLHTQTCSSKSYINSRHSHRKPQAESDSFPTRRANTAARTKRARAHPLRTTILARALTQTARARKTLTSSIIHQTCTKTARTHAESMRMRAPPCASIPTFLLIFFYFLLFNLI